MLIKQSQNYEEKLKASQNTRKFLQKIINCFLLNSDIVVIFYNPFQHFVLKL